MPQPATFTASDAARLHDALTGLVAAGGTPGGVIVFGTAGWDQQVLATGVVAPECGQAAPGEHTVYDIASLTKVVATWPLAGQAVAAGLLDLDAPVRDFLPPVIGEAPSGEATVRQLITHTSGLRAVTRLDHYRGASMPLHELLCREPLDNPPGQHRYINRGYILLGLALAHIHSRPLHELAAGLWARAGMTATCYSPVARATHVAPTEQRLRGAPRIWGAVHDENAALLGGAAGHAGVFSTASDLATYAEHLLTAHDRKESLGDWLTVSLTPQAAIEDGLDRGLAWILADGGRTACHHGWTGTSLYLAPVTRRYLVICTNAIYSGPARERIAPLRALAQKTISAT